MYVLTSDMLPVISLPFVCLNHFSHCIACCLIINPPNKCLRESRDCTKQTGFYSCLFFFFSYLSFLNLLAIYHCTTYIKGYKMRRVYCSIFKSLMCYLFCHGWIWKDFRERRILRTVEAAVLTSDEETHLRIKNSLVETILRKNPFCRNCCEKWFFF